MLCGFQFSHGIAATTWKKNEEEKWQPQKNAHTCTLKERHRAWMKLCLSFSFFLVRPRCVQRAWESLVGMFKVAINLEFDTNAMRFDSPQWMLLFETVNRLHTPLRRHCNADSRFRLEHPHTPTLRCIQYYSNLSAFASLFSHRLYGLWFHVSVDISFCLPLSFALRLSALWCVSQQNICDGFRPLEPPLFSLQIA